ncbi:MAG TPA: hypothetical protein VN419_14475 [Humidesulfovibrio sp.]|uniref:hypothetical protein n=1 Tax=Humidesulfovibrio sp. TaxID=2910988 RepID=UPI002BAA25F4|nr:hypothetical protein [Humidesulfovibrio sp.]HWR05209.1 hypothetical protein [Humidesulfovibrio sp.]
MAERLRPWSVAGLAHLYLPEGADSSFDEPVAPATPEQALVDQAAAAAPGTASVPMESAAIEPVVWPAPWSVLAGRVRSTPRVIITYAALADDVAGAADPARRKLFQTILAYLAWPQGTTLFWPITFPAGVEPGTLFASDIFAAGVRHFGIRHVLCFGPGPFERARTLFPQEDKEVLLHAAPAPESLVSLLPHELHQALSHVKGLAID